jgi:PKD repeat protein
VYSTVGTFTVTLQIFNSAKGQKTATKTGYVTVSDPGILINGTDFLLINITNKLLTE